MRVEVARPEGVARAVRGPHGWSIDLTGDDRLHARAGLITSVLDAVRAAGGGPVHLWVPRPTAADDALAGTTGLVSGRELFQMRRPLPADEHSTLTVRAFRPGEDDASWLEVNNRAFASHPEQGAWDTSTLRTKLAEPWFDASGFLLYEEDGRLLGFCWTKIHADDHPPVGEIFVIAVDPDASGRGLGRGLTLAGLDHLAGRGLAVGMLYVDTTNVPALELYRQLGFTVDHVHRAYTAMV
ncbi:MAG TPA: mycothiol synthase [Acidimicrobiales bacterium]|nr:mycothiol synthase [Acidimicrobiales bacterium]